MSSIYNNEINLNLSGSVDFSEPVTYDISYEIDENNFSGLPVEIDVDIQDTVTFDSESQTIPVTVAFNGNGIADRIEDILPQFLSNFPRAFCTDGSVPGANASDYDFYITFKFTPRNSVAGCSEVNPSSLEITATYQTTTQAGLQNLMDSFPGPSPTCRELEDEINNLN